MAGDNHNVMEMWITMDDFRLDHKLHGKIEVVRVTGSLDMETFLRLEKFLNTLFLQQHFKVLIDCKELIYIASSGLGALVGFARRARDNGGDLKLVNVPERIHKIFDLLGVTKVFHVYSNEEEVLASFVTSSWGSRDARF